MTRVQGLIDWCRNLSAEQIISIWVAVGIVAVFEILRPIFAYIIIRMFKIKEKKKHKIKTNPFYEPLKSFFGFLGLYLAVLSLNGVFNISDELIAIINHAFKIGTILIVAIGFNKSITTKSSFIEKIKEKSDKDIDKATVNFIIKAVKVIIYIIAGFLIITELGYNLNGLVAGLGVGSLVITLAAQDTAKNLFGGLMIFLDKPFKIGDYINVNSKYEGTVEDISMRSTRIRTLDNSILYVPNSEISNTSVINCSQRMKRVYKFSIELDEDTPISKIERVKDKLVDMINSNEKVISDFTIVNFTEITNDGMIILLEIHIDVTSNKDFYAAKEEINYNIMQILSEENVKLASETQNIHIKG